MPLSLIGIGTFINYAKGDLGKEHLQNQIQGGLNFSSNLDNFFVAVPTVEIYTANILHIKSKNTLGDQTKYLLVSSIATLGVTELLKQTFNEERPDKSDNQSFPSGHTSIAFATATVLYYEYKESNKFLAFSGVAFATTTAVFRVLNNKHFTSDVLVGAGVGIAITQLAYNFKPLKNWHPFKSKKRTVFMAPMYRDNAIGIASIIRF